MHVIRLSFYRHYWHLSSGNEASLWARATKYCSVLDFCCSYCDKKKREKREFAPDDLNNSIWTESTTEE